MDYPPAYVPRDDLTEPDDLLDWFSSAFCLAVVLGVRTVCPYVNARQSFGIIMSARG